MSGDTKIPAAVISMLEGYPPEEQARIVETGKKLLQDRTNAQHAWQQAADDRYKFVVEQGKLLKATYPLMSEFEIVVDVRQRMKDKGSKYTFGNGRLLSEDTIKQYLRKAGVFPL